MIQFTQKALENFWHLALNQCSPLRWSVVHIPVWGMLLPKHPCPAWGTNMCLLALWILETQFGPGQSLGLWARAGPLGHAVPLADGYGAAGPSLRSSRSPQFLSPLDCDCWARIWTLPMALPRHPAPGMGLSTLSRPVPGLGRLLAPLPSWVTAPVACVETLQPSHLPAPSIHAGIVSSHCHAAGGIAKPAAESSKVCTSWILCLGQDHHPSCPGLGLSAPDPSSRPVSHVSTAELPA